MVTSKGHKAINATLEFITKPTISERDSTAIVSAIFKALGFKKSFQLKIFFFILWI